MRSCLLGLLLIIPLQAQVSGWLNWRGPLQTGASLESKLPTTIEPGSANELWSYPIKGAGTPVIADDRLYAFGFYGETGEDVQEALLCLDANSGKMLWEARFSDFISDIVYNRYAVGSPSIDPETGNVYLQLSNGRCVAFTRDGEQLWEVSLMEDFARLTFPNGRTGAPAVHGNLVIFHCVTANWGSNGPARDRFYAFDKSSGELVWYSSPGVRPVDSSFSMPVFAKLDGHDVFYAGTGCGNIVCVDANTGAPVWRYQLSQGGINSQVLLDGNERLIAIHGKENIDTTNKGRLVCIKIPTTYPTEPTVLAKEAELWRNDDLVAFTSSPVLAMGKVYSTIATGSLLCVDAKTGKTLWSEKLGLDQVHASPSYGDGMLYVPMLDGSFSIIDVTAQDPKTLARIELGETCLGAPAIWAGKIYLFTKSKLHCFGKRDGEFIDAPAPATIPLGSKITQLQIVPAEFALKPGDSVSFKIFGLDQNGRRIDEVPIDETNDPWQPFIPPTAKVKAKVDAAFQGNTLHAHPEAKLSAGAFRFTHNGLSATTRGRVVAGMTYHQDFEKIPLVMDSPQGEKVNFPPLPWLGARIKWHVLENDGSKVVANRLDNLLFQRTTNFFGSSDMHDYVLEADVMTDGNRRIMSTIGLVNQRYLITLVGNSRILEVSSNHERLKQSVPFKMKANQWYRLKTRVKAKPDGSGTIYAKAWPRDQEEPAEWTLEVPVRHCQPHGSPGILAFSPQSQKRVYIDNIKITPATN